MINEKNSSKTSMNKKKRKTRISLISKEELNEKNNFSTSYHIQNQEQLKLGMKKISNSIFFMIQKMKKNYEKVVQKHNDLIHMNNEYEKKFQELKKKYEMLSKLKKKAQFAQDNFLASVETNLLTKTIITKKFSDSSIFIDDKDSMFDEGLSVMKNKMKVNEDGYSIETMKKAYIRTRLKEDAMKHLVTRFKKNSIKLFELVENIFEKLNRIFDDFNKRMNVMKNFRRFKQIDQYREFHIFGFEFQRLANDVEIFDELILLKNLKNKMSFDLQKTFASETYKITDLHEFARLCQFIDQTLRNVQNKSVRDREYEEFVTTERDTTIVITQTIQQKNISATQSFECFISNSQTNGRISSQIFIEQINEFRCYNCNDLDHIFKNCLLSQKSRRIANVKKIIEDEKSKKKKFSS